MAKALDASMRHDRWGFVCLHYTVSESSGFIKIKIQNKTRKPGKIGIRTIELPEGAQSSKDFIPVNLILEF